MFLTFAPVGTYDVVVDGKGIDPKDARTIGPRFSPDREEPEPARRLLVGLALPATVLNSVASLPQRTLHTAPARDVIVALFSAPFTQAASTSKPPRARSPRNEP